MGNIFASTISKDNNSAVVDPNEYFTSDAYLSMICDSDCAAKRKADGPETSWKKMQDLLSSTRETWEIIQILATISIFTFLLPHPLIGLALEITAVLMFDSIWLDV